MGIFSFDYSVRSEKKIDILHATFNIRKWPAAAADAAATVQCYSYVSTFGITYRRLYTVPDNKCINSPASVCRGILDSYVE